MAGTFRAAIGRSESDFERYIKPIAQYMFKGDLIPVEGDAGQIAKILDTQCGIDYLLNHNGSIYGVASRIQPLKKGQRPYNTFTVRIERESGTKTEYEKRVTSVFDGSIYPKITYQAYVSHDGKLQSMAVAFTNDVLLNCLLGNAKTGHTGADQIGQASFYEVDWNAMIRNGCTMRTYSRNLGLIQHFEKGDSFDLYTLDENGMPDISLQVPT